MFNSGEFDTEKFPTIAKILADYQSKGKPLSMEEQWLLWQYMEHEY